MPIRLQSERFSCYSHLTGAVFGLIGTIIILILIPKDPMRIFLALVYGFGNIFLFSASATYHYLKTQENEMSLARRIDHIAIFVLIASSYTPLCYFYLEGWMQMGIIIAQWSLVIIGFILKIFFINTPRWVTSGIYVLMGWMLILPIQQLIENIPIIVITLVLIGGIMATIGAVIYATKKPDPKPGVFGFHDIFHLFVMIGDGFLFGGIAIALVR